MTKCKATPSSLKWHHAALAPAVTAVQLLLQLPAYKITCENVHVISPLVGSDYNDSGE